MIERKLNFAFPINKIPINNNIPTKICPEKLPVHNTPRKRSAGDLSRGNLSFFKY